MTAFAARAADAVMLLHFAFILFVVLGALSVWWRRRMAFLHIPCALYGVAISFASWVCPLTYLELYLRQQARQAGYQASFIEHYLLGIIYPANYHTIHYYLGAGLLLLNLILYLYIFWPRKNTHHQQALSR